MKVQSQDLKVGQYVNYNGHYLTVSSVQVFESSVMVFFEEWSHCVISSQFASFSPTHELEVL